MSDLRPIHAPNLVALLIDTYADGDFKGRIQTLYDKELIPVTGAGEMLVAVDELLDDWNYPQRATMQRYFLPSRGAKEKERKSYAHIDSKERVHSIEDLYAARGDAASFILQVEYRQNASWQGQAVWLEKGVQQHFASALELIRMLDNALAKEKERK